MADAAITPLVSCPRARGRTALVSWEEMTQRGQGRCSDAAESCSLEQDEGKTAGRCRLSHILYAAVQEHVTAQRIVAEEGQLACSSALLFALVLGSKLSSLSAKMYFCPSPILILPAAFLSLPLSGLYLRGARRDGGRGFPYRRCGMGCEEASEIGRAFKRLVPACAGVAAGSLAAFGYGPAWLLVWPSLDLGAGGSDAPKSASPPSHPPGVRLNGHQKWGGLCARDPRHKILLAAPPWPCSGAVGQL